MTVVGLSEKCLSRLQSSFDWWMPSLSMMLAAILDQLSTIVTQVSPPVVPNKAYRIYSSLFEMVESKLEWAGSKLDVLEQRSMREQYSEHELQRIVSVEFESWNIEQDQSYFTRIFKQEYHKLWHSRRRYALRYSDLHRELCQGHVLLSVYESSPNAQHTAKLSALVADPWWARWADIANNKRALKEEVKKLEFTLINQERRVAPQ